MYHRAPRSLALLRQSLLGQGMRRLSALRTNLALYEFPNETQSCLIANNNLLPWRSWYVTVLSRVVIAGFAHAVYQLSRM